MMHQSSDLHLYIFRQKGFNRLNFVLANYNIIDIFCFNFGSIIYLQDIVQDVESCCRMFFTDYKYIRLIMSKLLATHGQIFSFSSFCEKSAFLLMHFSHF